MSETELQPLSSLTPALRHQLQERTSRLLFSIVRANASTQFGCTSPILAGLREALDNCSDDDSDHYTHSFRKFVPFSAYDDYQSYYSRFFEEPCKESQVKDLFAPGFPKHLHVSSATSGKKPKFLAKYPFGVAREGFWKPSIDTTTVASYVMYMGYRVIKVEDQNGHCVADVKVCSSSSTNIRERLGLDTEDDASRMAKILPGHAAPFAVAFISQYRTFLLIHAMFAMLNRDLGKISMAFLSTFADMLRYAEDEYPTLLHSIENGTIPNFEGLDHVRCYLEVNIVPNPDRAAELRAAGVPSSSPGWVGRIWPKCQQLLAIAGGPFAAAIPKVNWWLGSSCSIRPLGFMSTECNIAFSFGTDQYKLLLGDIVEFLDISVDESAENLVAAWDVETGKQYEIVVTTRNGLWRYRMDDVVEIVGFSPQDGSPIFKFVERRSGGIRLEHTFTSEALLKKSVLSTRDSLGEVLEFTVTVDDRSLPPTLGYLVELGKTGATPQEAPQQILDTLCAFNDAYQRAINLKKLRKPTVRVVEPGTFKEFRRWKAERSSGTSIGQIKVPVAFYDEATKQWMEQKVAYEL